MEGKRCFAENRPGKPGPMKAAASRPSAWLRTSRTPNGEANFFTFNLCQFWHDFVARTELGKETYVGLLAGHPLRSANP
jgi:hypothetical protein